MTYQSMTQEGQSGTETQVSFVDTSLFMIAWGQYSLSEAHLPKGHLFLCTCAQHWWRTLLFTQRAAPLDGLCTLNTHLTPLIPTAWLCPVQTLLYLKPPCCCLTQKQSNACSGAAGAHSWGGGGGIPNNLWRTATAPKQTLDERDKGIY